MGMHIYKFIKEVQIFYASNSKKSWQPKGKYCVSSYICKVMPRVDFKWCIQGCSVTHMAKLNMLPLIPVNYSDENSYKESY